MTDVPVRADDRVSGTSAAPEPFRFSPDLVAPRFASAIVFVALVGYFLVELVNVWDLRPDRSTFVICLVSVAGIFAVQSVHCWRRFRHSSWRRWAPLTLATQAFFTYWPLYLFGEAWGGVEGFLLASILLLVTPFWLSWTVYLALVAATGVVAAVSDIPADQAVYLVVANALTGLVVFAVTRLADLVAEVHAARANFAEIAVESERNRFARDLHDLLGYSLSAITLKSELAYRTVATNPQQAQTDIGAVVSIARQSLVDVRSVARSYRDMSLNVQATSARSVLESAGIRVKTDLPDERLEREIDTVLATAVREGVTNVLRHSKASNCEIALRRCSDAVTLIVSNDGLCDEMRARAGQHGFGDGKGGLENLRTRAEQVGGSLSAIVDDAGWFRLEVSAPHPS